MGVLRLSRNRGATALYEEFGALQRCLLDAMEVLGGSAREREQIAQAVGEALDSALTELLRLEGHRTTAARVPFNGLVVELFERAEEPVLLESPSSGLSRT
jgi:hypothetical protein